MAGPTSTVIWIRSAGGSIVIWRASLNAYRGLFHHVGAGRPFHPVHRDLDFREVVFGITPEDHSRPLHVNLAGGNDDGVSLLLHVLEDRGVGLAQLLVRPLVQQRQAAAAGEFTYRHAIDALGLADWEARLKVGVVLFVFRVVVQQERLAADVPPERSAEPAEAFAAVAVASLHADAPDEHRVEDLL